MAFGNWRDYLRGREEVSLKKYLYVFRPLLACRWILWRVEHAGFSAWPAKRSITLSPKWTSQPSGSLEIL